MADTLESSDDDAATLVQTQRAAAAARLAATAALLDAMGEPGSAVAGEATTAAAEGHH